MSFRKLMSTITDLNYLLLGLLARRSQTAYSLSRSLASTPMGVYSDSPGSVYPAVRKLARMGLVEKSPALPSAPGRQPSLLEITQKGRSELRRWLDQPVTSQELTSRPGVIVLRLALVSAVLGEKRLPRFLAQLAAESNTARDGLHSFASEHHDSLPLGSRLPLELAREILDTYARWAQWTLKKLEQTAE